jgi:hypothetical protein
MAELSVDEAQRLARLFLTGQAGSAEIQRLQNALADDQGAALELLSQMQAALDDSAPSGLTVEQDRVVNGRIEALIAPRVKKRGFFAFILKLFKRKPKPTEEESQSKSRRRRRGGSPEPEPAPAVETAPVTDSMDETLPGGGMEEMAPIAAASAPAAEVESPRTDFSPDEDKPAPARKRGLPGWLLPLILILLIVTGLGYGVRWFLRRPKALKPVVVEVVQPPVAAITALPSAAVSAAPTAVTAKPSPTLSPTPVGRGHRAMVVGAPGSEPLPAQLPPTTPVSAGQWP